MLNFKNVCRRFLPAWGQHVVYLNFVEVHAVIHSFEKDSWDCYRMIILAASLSHCHWRRCALGQQIKFVQLTIKQLLFCKVVSPYT